MKKKLIAVALLAGGSMFAQTRFSFGVSVGGNRGYYTQAPVYASAIPPCPGPDYTWVDGYWSNYGGHRSWVAGSWNRRPVRDYDRRFDNRFDRGSDRRYDRDRDHDRDDNRNITRYSNGYRNR